MRSPKKLPSKREVFVVFTDELMGGADIARREHSAMIISIPVSDTVIREAKNHNMTVEEFVESLIDKGMETSTGRPILSDAIERIRSLRNEVKAQQFGR
jgi:hypothetical protein